MKARYIRKKVKPADHGCLGESVEAILKMGGFRRPVLSR